MRRDRSDDAVTIPQAQPPRFFAQKLDHFNALGEPTLWSQRRPPS